jgi:hypothetical protein
MTFKRLLGLAMAMVAVAMLVGSVGAGAARTPAKPALNLSTNAKVREYLRSLGISPRGVVIQRGARNYAGPRCPGKRWACTRSHRVVQIATHRGKNSFRCSLSRCVVVQLTKSLLATNIAKCIRTTGITQSCSINQTSTGSNGNQAIVVEIAKKLTGLTQSASQTAQIVQTADSGSNTACVRQTAEIEGSTVAKRGMPVSVNLDSHESILIAQNSHSGGNTVQGATPTGGCSSDPLNQSQTIRSTATGTSAITQNLNKMVAGRNMLLDIEQNQSDGYFGTATGANTAESLQTNSLTALATSPNGLVHQWESQPDEAGGGVDAIVNQDSRDVSSNNSTQMETQCLRAVTSGTPSCGSVQNTLPVGWTQTQFGPVRKGGCCSSRHADAGRHFMLRKGSSPSSQTGNNNDIFTIHQESTQDTDAAPSGHPEQVTQANFVQGECSTPGNCTAHQETDINGEQAQNESSGQNVSSTINCSGSSCVGFDGSPGTNAPPGTLGGYAMTQFGLDPQPVCPDSGYIVAGVSDPAGTVTFSQPLQHDRATISCWATWSHGYTGDVYDTLAAADPTQVTLTLPAGTKAFYLYAEPNVFDLFDVTATAQDGTTSGPVQVQGNSGARYFGFYGTGDAEIATITITTTDTSGLGIGEFGIFPAGPPIT